jgi:hypothetical protein
MNTKLTLSVDAAIIERAKAYAKKTGRSLSEIIENYLESITRENGSEKVSSRLKKIVGSVTLPSDFDEKKALQSYFHEKHG